ncbi:MAG: right-handed parallel beta-helix repeat-containing protein, partial [Bacteroidota bacterium]
GRQRGTSSQARVLGNSIFNNDELGIEVDATDRTLQTQPGDGVTANDNQDADTGPNGLQNFPVITSSTTSGGTTTIVGTLNSTPSTTGFRIEFFSNTVCNGDSLGNTQTAQNGEGETFLGFTTVNTDSNGDASFSVPLSLRVADGAFITATATDSNGNTSEFAMCVTNTVNVPTPTFVVSNTNDSGAGSLRQAILDANASNGKDTITFNIPGNGPHSIMPTSALPEITDTVFIDGSTEPGAVCTTWPPTLLIEIDGSNAGDVDGLVLTNTASGSTIKGLVINSFSRGGIVIDSSSNNTIQCNFIGTDVNGNNAKSNGRTGILFVDDSDNNLIGGTSPGQGNLLSGNLLHGISVTLGGSRTRFDEDTTATANNNKLQGNLVGTNAAGTVSVPNGFDGLHIDDFAQGWVIGGTESGARNILSGNDGAGIEIDDKAHNILVQGNFIGTDITGTKALPNGDDGVTIDDEAFDITVGGISVAARNIISGNGRQGFEI